MADGIRWVGLDVHATQTAGAVFDTATGEVRSRRIAGRPHEALEWLTELPGPVRAVYEAGPTGYGLARRARAAGIDMQVCAPGMIAKGPGDRVKTDKRDALKLARLHAAGQLVLVHVPALEHEQLRDLSRCREDVRADLMRARHRIGKFLLRREIYFTSRGRGGGRAWTREHRTWLAGLRFADRPSELTFTDYLHAHDVMLARRAMHSTARSTRSRATRRGPRSSAGCAACTASTRCRRSGSAPRSATSSASSRPPPSAPTSGWSRPSTRAATSAARARSPRPALRTPAACWSKPPTTTPARRASAARWGAARTATSRG